MDRSRFARPVSIFVGLGFPHEVGTPAEAYRVLNEWSGSRGPTHAMAVNVCRLATVDEAQAGAAWIAFEAFVRARGILAPEIAISATESHSHEWLSS